MIVITYNYDYTNYSPGNFQPLRLLLNAGADLKSSYSPLGESGLDAILLSFHLSFGTNVWHDGHDYYPEFSLFFKIIPMLIDSGADVCNHHLALNRVIPSFYKLGEFVEYFDLIKF